MIQFRKATLEDAKLLFDWRNDPQTRHSAFETAVIPWDRHVQWLTRKLQNPQTHIFILYNEARSSVGQIRFDVDKGVGYVDIAIDPKERKKGYATEGLLITCPHMFKTASLRKIVAHVKKDNEASYRSFRKAGFQDLGVQEIKETSCYVLELP